MPRKNDGPWEDNLANVLEGTNERFQLLPGRPPFRRACLGRLLPRICEGADERFEPLNRARYLRTPVWKRILYTYLDEGADQADGKPTGQS